MSTEQELRERALVQKLLLRARAEANARASTSGILHQRARLLSSAQDAFYADESPVVATTATRQSGKTTTGLEKLAKMFFGTPGSISYGAMPTRDIVRDTLWDRWKELCNSFGLTDDNHNETRLETRWTNGSIARFIGVKDRKRADRVRGQTANLIWVDEAATWPDDLLQYFVQDVAEYALGVKRGQLLLTSTPGMDPSGFFYELATKQSLSVSRHFLGLHDNPAWTDPDEYLQRMLDKYGLTVDDPKVQREWFGRWVADLRSRVYHLEERNLVDGPIPYDLTVMAIDLGAVDESAFCVLGWQHGSRKLGVVHEEAHGEIDLTTVAEIAKKLQEKYRPLVTMVDGAAKQSVMEIQNRHGIALEATPKAPDYKAKAIAQANADFRRGLIDVPRGFELVGQMKALQWKANAVGVKEKPGQANDRCDAFLYAFLRALHYVEHEPADKIVVGSPEWWKQEQRRVRDEHVEHNQVKDQLDPFTAKVDPFSNQLDTGDPW